MSRPPLIGLCADSKLLEPHIFQCVGDKYISAVSGGAGGQPLLIPSTPDAVDVDALIDTLDALVLPGSVANVHPSHYSDEAPYEGSPLDPTRDGMTLNLVSRAIEAGLPLLGLCRGFQEMNVALGGSLHQKIHEVPGFFDHRENPQDPLNQQYGESHEVILTEGGLLRGLSEEPRVRVNSLHGQGVKQLAPGLRIEATSTDGVIEAFSVIDSAAVALAIQWHPEWRYASHPLYLSIWQAFGDAARARAEFRHSQREPSWQPSVAN